MAKTLEQLRQLTWKTKPEAMKELKRNHIAEKGDTYELREYKPGLWMLCDAKRPRGHVDLAKPAVRESAQDAGLTGKRLPTDKERPNAYAILISDVAQFDMYTTAQTISRKINHPVWIVNEKYEVMRKVDARGGAPLPEERERPERAGRKRGPRQGQTKQSIAIELLKRPNGATSKELSAAMGWNMAFWHVNRAAEVSGCKLVELGARHWRLEELPAH